MVFGSGGVRLPTAESIAESGESWGPVRTLHQNAFNKLMIIQRPRAGSNPTLSAKNSFLTQQVKRKTVAAHERY